MSLREEMGKYLEALLHGKGGSPKLTNEEPPRPNIESHPDVHLSTADFQAGMTAIVESVLEHENGEPRSILRPDEYLDGLEQALALLGMAATNRNRLSIQSEANKLINAYPHAKQYMRDPHARRLNEIIDAFTTRNSKAYPNLTEHLKKNMRFKLD